MPPIVNITPTIPPTFAWQSGNVWRDANARARILARFWTFVNRAKAKNEDCREWTGYVNDRGYGVFGFRRSRALAHRLVWWLTHGEIPASLEVCHGCDNPRCVNPNHLRLDTRRGNHLESVRKGRKRAWGLQKLDAARVAALRHQYAQGGVTQRALAAQYGIARNTVSGIVHRKSWAHLPSDYAGEHQRS